MHALADLEGGLGEEGREVLVGWLVLGGGGGCWGRRGGGGFGVLNHWKRSDDDDDDGDDDNNDAIHIPSDAATWSRGTGPLGRLNGVSASVCKAVDVVDAAAYSQE